MISLDNLSNIEKERFQNSIKLILNLFSESKKEEVIDTYFGDLITEIIIKDGYTDYEAGAIQEVDSGHYSVEYGKYNSEKKIESLHQSIHELIHILGVPNEKLTAGKDANGGLQIAELNNETGRWEYYGHLMNEACDELLTKIALSMVVQSDDVNYTADEVILSNEVFHSSGYKVGIPIARLLAFAMNNEFDREYSDLMEQGIGIVDGKTDLDVPINDFFYGMAIDPLYTERRFDEYSKDGEYKRINKNLDNAFESGNMSVDLLKETMISISDMFNNKMYQYRANEMISEDVYNKSCEQYEVLFSRICEYYRDIYDVEIIFNDRDNMKMFESMINSQEERKNSFLRSRHINTSLNIEAQEQIQRDMNERNMTQNHNYYGE